jgi:hypothetical protein
MNNVAPRGQRRLTIDAGRLGVTFGSKTRSEAGASIECFRHWKQAFAG